MKVVQAASAKVKSCEATFEIVQFGERWDKVAWGPPINLRVDVEKTTSITYPYKGIVNFDIPYSSTYRTVHSTEEDAERDLSLRELVYLRASLRYELRISADGKVSVGAMQIKTPRANNTSRETWDDYAPIRPERFCWITTLR